MIVIPLRSNNFRCLLFIPSTKLLGWVCSHAREFTDSDIPSSMTDLAISDDVETECEPLGAPVLPSP